MIRALAALALLLTLACIACAPVLHTSARESIVIERLYFGRNVAGSLAVSDQDWAAFLGDFVTPRFPEGLTTWKAEGQWRGGDQRIEREPSFVVEIMHPASAAAADTAIASIVAEYKRRFHQEAVLRVVVPARASY